jgi:2-C-methyl-D-erythritol 4-phosphate cytidylyltransferase
VPVEPGAALKGAAPDCPALRDLAGVPLVCRAVAVLRASGCVGEIVVPVPAALAEAVGAVLGNAARLVPAPDTGLLAAALAASPEAGSSAGGPVPVVVHDVLHPLAAPELVRAVVDALAASPDAVGAVAVRPVTDTLKWVDADGMVTGTADRERYRVVCSPQAYRPAVLRAAGAPDDPAGLPAFAGRHGRLIAVPAPQEVFRVAGPDDLELAEAVLAISPQTTPTEIQLAADQGNR